MKVEVLKPCIINRKPHKPSKKVVTVSQKDGAILVGLGKVKDLTPKKEPVAINLDIDVAALEEVKKEITAKDESIATLTAKVEELGTEGEAKDATITELTASGETKDVTITELTAKVEELTKKISPAKKEKPVPPKGRAGV